ncbi:MAG: metal ABC transporter permease [Phycisphaeraceae bacterium]|nr:metal ABC transporter permease [Phycisphaeraceae bacterium]
MIPFIESMRHNPFLGTGLLAGLLASLACGLIGPYVITRRIVFLAGAIAHMAVGGIGTAIYLSTHYPQSLGWLTPLGGAILWSLASAVIIGLIHHRARERLDTLIGAMWAVGMSIGILLIKLTPGYHAELMSYLFGSISFVSREQLLLMAFLDAVIVGALMLFHKRLLAICLDQQQAQLQGVNVLAMNILLLSLVALTVVCLIQVVGLILVIALLTLPAATAAHHAWRMGSLMLIATLLCAVVTTGPRMLVYGTQVSPESAIVLAAGLVYLASVVVERLRRGLA